MYVYGYGWSKVNHYFPSDLLMGMSLVERKSDETYGHFTLLQLEVPINLQCNARVVYLICLQALPVVTNSSEDQP